MPRRETKEHTTKEPLAVRVRCASGAVMPAYRLLDESGKLVGYELQGDGHVGETIATIDAKET